MPNLAAVLKAEIVRLARRSTRPFYVPLKKDIVALKHALTQQKRLTSQLQRDNARLLADLNNRLAVPSTASETEVQHARMSPRLIRSQRARLGLSQDAFAELVDVSAGAVMAWESGRSKPRAAAKAMLVAVRKLGKREARQRLEALAETNGPVKEKAQGARAQKTRPRRTAAS